MPMPVFVGTVLLLSWGNLGGHLVRSVVDEPILATAGFVVTGFFAGSIGQYAGAVLVGLPTEWPLVAFLAASGALLGALLRAVLFERDDPLVMVSVGLLLWLFADLPLSVDPTQIAVALGVTVLLGYLAYALETASLPGMVTGVFLGLQTIVLGDFGWFFLLLTFFGVGGLSTKFRYEEVPLRGETGPRGRRGERGRTGERERPRKLAGRAGRGAGRGREPDADPAPAGTVPVRVRRVDRGRARRYAL